MENEVFNPNLVMAEKQAEENDFKGYDASKYRWFGDDVPENAVLKCLMCDNKILLSRKKLLTDGVPTVCDSCKRKALFLFDAKYWENYIKLELREFEFFLNQYGELYAAHTDALDVRRIFPIRSDEMKAKISLVCKSRGELDQAQLYMEGLAYRANVVHKLDTRVCSYEGNYWLDLCDDSGKAVMYNAEGWRIVDKPPIIFRRWKNMLPLEIDRAGTREDFDKYLGLFRFETQEDKLRFLGILAQGLAPDIDKPIAIFTGAQGATKTTSAVATRMVFDPSSMPTTNIGKDPEGLPQKIVHNYMAVFDNCNMVSLEISDLLCQASSGLGFSKRKLYTDDDEVSIFVKRCVLMTGISSPSMQPDFLDRTTLIELERVPDSERREKDDIERERDALLPKMRGFMLTTFCNALANPAKTKIPLPRLAGYAKIADAFAVQLGYSEGEFIRAYIEANNNIAQEAMQANPITANLLELLKARGNWIGTAKELLHELRLIAGEDAKAPGFPKNEIHLSRDICGKLKPGLIELGWGIKKETVDNRKLISITKVSILSEYTKKCD